MFNDCGLCKYKGLCAYEDDMKAIKKLEESYSFINISCRYHSSILVNAPVLNPAPAFKQSVT